MANSYTEYMQEQNSTIPQNSLRATIVDCLQNSNKEIFWPSEDGWVLYVKDHFEEIRSQSTIVELEESDGRIYAYSVESFLQSKNYPISIAWIVMWLNQLDSCMYFDDTVSRVLIPNVDKLRTLKKQYISSRVTYENAFGTKDL